MPERKLVLGSASPRRKQLLASFDLPFQVESADIDESPGQGEAADAYVERLAQAKAEAVLAKYRFSVSDVFVLGVDTTVAVDDLVMGKPADEQDAARMLQRLSDRWHEVHTAVCLAAVHRSITTSVCSRVKFCALTPRQIAWYWATGEPRDKAGSYGIQGLGGMFVEQIAGSYSAIVGLPLFETSALLAEAGFQLWSTNNE